jgi:hypothetical protein
VRLARPAGADEQDVLALVEILTFDQLQKQWPMDARAGLDVELIEQLLRGETGHLQSPFGCLAFSLDQLQLAELQQKRQVIGIVRRRALGDSLALRMDSWQLECFQMVLQ